jgi:hypothetical protein
VRLIPVTNLAHTWLLSEQFERRPFRDVPMAHFYGWGSPRNPVIIPPSLYEEIRRELELRGV